MFLQFSSFPFPLKALNGVAGFKDFQKEIVIPHTLLYFRQEAYVLSTAVDEMKTLFGMLIACVSSKVRNWQSLYGQFAIIVFGLQRASK